MKRQRFKHSILFGDGTLENGQFVGLDTYKDFHLIPSSRPTIAMPGIETKYVTIPGRDGTLDLSNYLREDRPAYGDRSGNFEFVVENDFDVDARPEEFWMTIYPRLVNTLHGKKFKMVLLEDDPDYFWEGRFSVEKYEPGEGHHSEVSIAYQVGPYKWKIRPGNDDIAWDNFNFERDNDNHINAGYCYGNGGVVRIEVTGANSGTKVQFGNEQISLGGRSKAQIIRPIDGKKQIALIGTGHLTWREGSL